MVDDFLSQYNQSLEQEVANIDDEEEEIEPVQMGIYDINGDGLVTILFN